MSGIGTLLRLSTALTLSLGVTSTFGAEKLERQTSNAGSVSIVVQPLDVAPDAKSWDFEVTLNTHTQPLDQDLVKASTLVDAAGGRHAPTTWKGDPPGGHHRRGVLQFAPLAGSQQYVELQIRDVGSTKASVFRWRLR